MAPANGTRVQRSTRRSRNESPRSIQRDPADEVDLDIDPQSPDAIAKAEEKKAKAAKESTSRKLSELDDLIDAIEERVLAQLERRGGRYQGAF